MFYGLHASDHIPLDEKLNKIIDKDGGVFIELGANDGLCQSNTAYFEFHRKWTGVLIEPCYKQYEKCVRNRPNSAVFHAACVSKEEATAATDGCVRGDFQSGHLMSSIGGQRLQNKNLCTVPATTLDDILTQHFKSDTAEIDFLSLDTEGHEYNILLGLDLTKFSPRYVLIEIYKKDLERIMSHMMCHGYNLHSNFSNYTSENYPGWDTTHNDYLFIRKDVDVDGINHKTSSMD